MKVVIRKEPPAAAGHTSASACSRLSDVKRTIWLTRPDLRELCEGDWERFDWWLLLNGAREYRAIAEAGVAVSEVLLAEPAEEAIAGVRPPLTRLMVQLWRMRPDLQASFDLRTAEGQQAFAWWLVLPDEMERCSFTTLPEKVVKIGAKVIRTPATPSFRWPKWRCRAICSGTCWNESDVSDHHRRCRDKTNRNHFRRQTAY